MRGCMSNGLMTIVGSNAGVPGKREAELPAQEDMCQHKETSTLAAGTHRGTLSPRLRKEARNGSVC